MPGAYGLSFQPGTDQEASGQDRDRTNVAPAQEAIRLLSLRLPSVVGARAISPDALLRGGGSADFGTNGFTLDAALELLRKLRTTNLPPQLQGPQSGSADSGGRSSQSSAGRSTQPTMPGRGANIPQGILRQSRVPTPVVVTPGESTGRPQPDFDTSPTTSSPPKPPKVLPGDLPQPAPWSPSPPVRNSRNYIV